MAAATEAPALRLPRIGSRPSAGATPPAATPTGRSPTSRTGSSGAGSGHRARLAPVPERQGGSGEDRKQRRKSVSAAVLAGDMMVDTCTLWAAYSNKASGEHAWESRDPMWQKHGKPKPSDDGEFVEVEGMAWVEAQTAAAQRKRELRRILHEERGRRGPTAQRLDVTGKVRADSVDIANQQRRIKSAIRECSKARQQLAAMKRVMCELVPELAEEARQQPEAGGGSQQRDEQHPQPQGEILPPEGVKKVHDKLERYRELAKEYGGKLWRTRGRSSANFEYNLS